MNCQIEHPVYIYIYLHYRSAESTTDGRHRLRTAAMVVYIITTRRDDTDNSEVRCPRVYRLIPIRVCRTRPMCGGIDARGEAQRRENRGTVLDVRVIILRKRAVERTNAAKASGCFRNVKRRRISSFLYRKHQALEFRLT